MTHFHQLSMYFPFFMPYSVFRGSGNAFWHPCMFPTYRSPQFIHPPMLPIEEPTMDFLHLPMFPQEEDNLFSMYLHLSMMLPAEDQSIPQQQKQQQQQPQSLEQQGHQGHSGYPGDGYHGPSHQQVAEYYNPMVQTY